MNLINKFHKMESENLLFQLGSKYNFPLWDIVRYNVYLKYYYSETDRIRLESTVKHSFIDYLFLIKFFLLFVFRFPFCKGENIILTCSRYLNEENRFFDKSAFAIINSLKRNCTIIEPVFNSKMAYPFLYDFSNVLRRFQYKKILSIDDFNKIENALLNHLGESKITYDEINRLLLNFKSDLVFFKFLFKIKSTKKIFISTGNPKSQIQVAKDLNIKTYLLQHASIEFDEIDYSYPDFITRSHNILFADYVLTFGNYWCKGLNVPAKGIIPIGNDFFYNKPGLQVDNTILIVSTIVHGGELKQITKKIANERKDLSFIYKLHPNEFHYLKEYQSFFKDNLNVKVIAKEIDTNLLISKSVLVVLIVSAVLYEALNQNKKVAIYKKINYKRQLNLLHLKNVYLFDNVSDFQSIYNKEIVNSEVHFYNPTNYYLIDEILSGGYGTYSTESR